MAAVKDGSPTIRQQALTALSNIGGDRCCAADEFPKNGQCVKRGPIDPGQLKLPCITPDQRAPNGDCCRLPQIPGVWECETPPPPPPPVLVQQEVERFTIQFKEGRPHKSDSLDDSLEYGRGRLDDAIEALSKLDLTTSAELVANASQEGNAGQNLDLTDRRRDMIVGELGSVRWKVKDTIPQLLDLTGCRGSAGAYSCGTKNATPKVTVPRERNVTIVMYQLKEIKPFPKTPSPWPTNPWNLPLPKKVPPSNF